MGEIKPLGLLEVLRRIEKRGALEKTRKVRQRCVEVYCYAIITGRAEYNPAPDLAIALAVPKQKHHPFLSDAPRGEQCTVHYSLTHHYLSR